ncbi:MAG: PAS domain-containing sensor histidine kinase [Pyrinomonadaceae bacterium]|nr:PAS domain-containing sensor histidine kinase [Sphingobacteriaceae bacterium]
MDNLELFHAIINSGIDGLITISDCGEIETANPAALKLFGYSELELKGKNICVLMNEPDRTTYDDYLKRDLSKSEDSLNKSGRDVSGLRKNGTIFPFRLAVNELDYENRKIYTGFIHDLSKEQNADELGRCALQIEKQHQSHAEDLEKIIIDLERARDEAVCSLDKEKELCKLKTRFVSMASHEFRIPLSSVRLSASLIDTYLEKVDPHNVLKHTEKIKNSVIHLTAILNDFLSLEKLETGKIEVLTKEFDLVRFSEDLIEEMQLIVKPNQHIVYQHTGEMSQVSLDPFLLKSAAINLISNAVKYSGENSFIEFNTEISDTEVNLTIKDNGIGIPLSDQKNLFEPFFRAHNAGNVPGTGLGLNIVKRYVDLMGGKVMFISSENLGTSISLIFDSPIIADKII